MDGRTLKTKVTSLGMTIKEIADRLEMSPQALNTIFKVNDVKTGFIERLCIVLGVDMSFFYPSSSSIENTHIETKVKDNHGNLYSGNNQNITSNERSDKTLEIISKLLAANAKKDEHIEKMLEMLSSQKDES